MILKVFRPVHAGYFIRRKHFENAIHAIKNLHFSSVLDAGCGDGQYSFYLAKLNPSADITAYDINKHQIEQNKIKGKGVKNIEFIQKDLTEIEDLEIFDLIVCIDVLEHIQNDKGVIELLYKALKKGGKMYLHVPCSSYYRHFNKFKNWIQEDHVRMGYSRDTCLKMLDDVGFKVLKFKGTFGWHGSLAWELYMSSSNILYKLLIFPLIRLLAYIDVKRNNKQYNAFYFIIEK